MNEPRGEINQQLNKANTVAIIVHGVGDHSPVDILDSALKGYRHIAPEASQAEYITIPEFPQPDGTNGPQRALQIEANGEIHIVLPVVWCDLRMRASHATRPPLLRPLDTGYVGRALAPVIVTWLDLLRCLFKTRSLAWRIAIAVGDLLLVAMTCALWGGTIWLMAVIWWYLYQNMGHGVHWYNSLLLVPALLAMRYGLKRLLPLFDFIGDIAAYIGRMHRRQEIETTLLGIVEAACQRAPKARILLAGHSLGSVLVSHAALHMQTVPSGLGRVSLVTLGSPLRRMSRVFPGQIRSPDEIERALEKSRAIGFWVNLWRDCDFIGRDLTPEHQTFFAETSLGDGPHWNIWADERLWRTVVSLLQVRESRDFNRIKLEWALEPSIDVKLPDVYVKGEKWPEVYVKAFSIWLRRIIVVPLISMSMVYLIYWGPAGRWFGTVPPNFSLALWATWALTEVLSIALFLASLSPPDPIGKPLDRKYLGELRRTKAVSDFMFVLVKFSLATFFLTLCWALNIEW